MIRKKINNNPQPSPQAKTLSHTSSDEAGTRYRSVPCAPFAGVAAW